MTEDFPEHIQNLIKTLPETPGVYQYYDTENTLLYVGKAKNLKKRVTSYFTKDHDNGRLRIMVNKIHDIKTVKVNSELDALLLENNLIKSLKPRYNINLRDDKTYPWIILKNERFPRLFYTRKQIKDGSEYFGPYASGKVMHTLLDLIRQTYPLRTCSYLLSKENIDKGKFRACLEFHIGRCKAPCVNKQEEDEYNQNISEIRQIIKGDIGFALRDLKDKMNEAAEKYEFEKAELLKNKIDVLSDYQSKSTIVHPSITNTDVINIISDEKNAYLHYFKIINGAIIHAQTIELKKKIEESDEDMLMFAIIEFRNRFKSASKEILVPFAPSIAITDCEYVIPKIGDKKKLLDLCYKNALAYKQERENQLALTDPERHTERIMNQMMKDLRMSEQPRRIEGFDNSNMQGEYAVSAMPVFIDGKPAKKEYRHFNVKTVVGPDDFATMEEVILRRYSRVLEENLPMPQLIVIDGGKGQLGAAVESLRKLNLMGKVAIIGIAKRLEEIYFPGDPLPLYLDKRSETLKIIQQIRDESHRFGITHHRNKRSRETFKTELNEIKGISVKTAEKLLIELKSVKNIKEATLEEMEKVIGASKAKLVYDFFNSQNSNSIQE
ncbi:excinuclease ABC subunit UvrC [Aurantibacillus circumpalustris]|uniref:excinuclease ABC subunit UvrC n=1 Tax=Aurantibacillus circumpalustris TaxID=3036359 RepID=UPI00295B04BD|nr:excinuclease ABC subunit UvrC [Aurantibacillus circumpalustris]